MSSLGSISRMVSALMASQQALDTTAHNLANVDTQGYVRQQVLMNESNYRNLGYSAVGTMSVGTGTDIESIRQVRDMFLDQAYREESGRKEYYGSINEAVYEIETIFGETEGETFSSIIENLWGSLNELSKSPEGLETRGIFVQNAVIFIEKANLISKQLNEYQSNVNTEVEETVDRINYIGSEIDRLNDVIQRSEASGGNANDYRDQRNQYLDELSGMIQITSLKEDSMGRISVSLENVSFVDESGNKEMEMVPSAALSTLMVPSWKHTGQQVFNFDNNISIANGNDVGRLKGLLQARGSRSADYTDMLDPDVYSSEVAGSAIMTAQAQFDNLVHGIVTMINDTLAPNTSGPPVVLDTATAPYGLDGSRGVEIFSRNSYDRYDSATGIYIDEDINNKTTHYSAGNLKVNTAILEDYDKICLSVENGNNGDNSVVVDILQKWDAATNILDPGSSAKTNISDYYTGLVGNLGSIGESSTKQYNTLKLVVNQLDNQRSSLMSVSSDEELGNMMKYQHAYNAASRVVTVVDSMIEQIVTSLGVVGR